MRHLADPIRRTRTLAISAAILLVLPPLAEGAKVMHVTWEELASVVGESVKIALPGGAVVTGMAAAVESDALVVNVVSTSDRKACPKGLLRVPRSTLHTLKMRTNSRKSWEVGMGLGTLVMGPFGGALGSLAGYGAGRVAGRWRWRQIEILP